MAKKSENYEIMLNKLKEIIAKMENGNIALEDSMKLYEEGISLTNKLYKTLKESENKIRILQKEELEDVSE
ncbi:exodeoxyribonuclease VII small subunit [Alloiococcus sp. CFN-8]|uniref:exodeoxyribonuclease VII small subunit n=1 Tax=Alloiococcus sp. CFN-8 TaxID=3416081 RepID=UPI003CF8C02A